MAFLYLDVPERLSHFRLVKRLTFVSIFGFVLHCSHSVGQTSFGRFFTDYHIFKLAIFFLITASVKGYIA